MGQSQREGDRSPIQVLGSLLGLKSWGHFPPTWPWRGHGGSGVASITLSHLLQCRQPVPWQPCWWPPGWCC